MKQNFHIHKKNNKQTSIKMLKKHTIYILFHINKTFKLTNIHLIEHVFNALKIVKSFHS